ncbi:MAG: hypothetical protein LBU13_01050 [Synergistaceae bacterium]|nr:hypothetical protein [Synergistaceae bacterium]
MVFTDYIPERWDTIFRASGLQGFRASGLQGFRASGLQGFRASGLQGRINYYKKILFAGIFCGHFLPLFFTFITLFKTIRHPNSARCSDLIDIIMCVLPRHGMSLPVERFALAALSALPGKCAGLSRTRRRSCVQYVRLRWC